MKLSAEQNAPKLEWARPELKLAESIEAAGKNASLFEGGVTSMSPSVGTGS